MSGGGWTRTSSSTSVRLCVGYAEDVKNQIGEVLTESETRRRRKS